MWTNVFDMLVRTLTTAPEDGGGGLTLDEALEAAERAVARLAPRDSASHRLRAGAAPTIGARTPDAGPRVPDPVRAAFERRVKAVRTFVETAGGFDALRAGLAELYGRLTGTEAGHTLTDQIHMATWGAQCAARLATAERIRQKRGGVTSAKCQVAGSVTCHLSPVTAFAAGDGPDLRRARFAEAIDQMAQRTDLLPKEEFLRLQGLDRSRAWTVARVADLDLLRDLHGAVGQAVEGGQTWREFLDSLDTIMERRGWAGLKPWHAQLVYEQNVNMAWSAGRVMQSRDAGVKYWRKLPSDSVAPRPEHQRYDNQVFTFDELTPPPWDFGCKCNWEVVFDEELPAGTGREPATGRDAGPTGATEFAWDAGHYYRPRELRRGDYPRELWPIIASLASNANALLKVKA